MLALAILHHGPVSQLARNMRAAAGMLPAENPPRTLFLVVRGWISGRGGFMLGFMGNDQASDGGAQGGEQFRVIGWVGG